jgi:hypothetical protein
VKNNNYILWSMEIMQSTPKEIIRCHCNICGHNTNHSILEQRIINDQDESDGYWWSDTYELLQCLGCDAICLRHFMEDASGDETEIFYPPPISRRAPSWIWRLPADMKELLNEIYVALHNDSRRLALMGARTLVDMLMLKEVGDKGTFSTKLKNLQEKGIISDQNREVLTVALDAGSAAAHRGYNPCQRARESIPIMGVKSIPPLRNRAMSLDTIL